MRVLAVISMLLLLASCRKDTIDTDFRTSFSHYAPFRQGSVLIYRIDSTIYDDFKDTVEHRLLFRRYEIDSFDNSISGRKLFRVVVSDADTSMKWRFNRVDQWALTSQYFETQENNIRFTHLIFPVNVESVWDVNQFNTHKEQLRYYTELSDTFMLDSILYTDALKVENEPRNNSVVNIEYKEVFVRNIGCVYKKITNIETQFGVPGGYSVSYKLHDYTY